MYILGGFTDCPDILYQVPSSPRGSRGQATPGYGAHLYRYPAAHGALVVWPPQDMELTWAGTQQPTGLSWAGPSQDT